MQKHRLLEQALPSLFPFSIPPPPPLFAPATQATVSKRKYLLNSLLDLKDIPKDTSTEDDNLTYEAPKRKFYESLNTWSVETFLNKICNDWLHMLLKVRSALSFKGTELCNIALNKVWKFVGIILSHLFNGEDNFGQPMSNIAVSQ